MAENKEEYLSISGFEVRITGQTWSTFENVTGLGIDFEDIAYQDNKNQIVNRPGRFNARDIRLTRSFRKDEELYKWVDAIKKGKKDRRDGSIVLKDDEGNKVVSFDFEDAWPKAWSGPVLSKEAESGNEIPKEEIVLSVQDLMLKK